MRVYKLLPIDGAPIRARGLEEKAEVRGMSPTTLHDGLKKLMETKIVEREEDESTYPHSVYYRRIAIPLWGDISPREPELKKIQSRARLVFKDDLKMAEAQRQRLEQLLKIKPSKFRDDKIAAEIAYDLSAMAALVGRALARIKGVEGGKGISITPDEYVGRVLEVRLHPLVTQLARLVKDGKVRGSHLRKALMILASRQAQKSPRA